jgi:Uncharacterized conserved protein (DUF2190)
MINECIPTVEAAYTQRITVHCDLAVLGKTFVGPLVQRQSGGLAGLTPDPLAAGDGANMRIAGPPAAGGEVGGVASWDAATGAKCPIIRGAGTRLPVTASAAVAAGNKLKVDAAGKVLPATTGAVIVGIAHSGAAGAGTDVEVELYTTPSQLLSP